MTDYLSLNRTRQTLHIVIHRTQLVCIGNTVYNDDGCLQYQDLVESVISRAIAFLLFEIYYTCTLSAIYIDSIAAVQRTEMIQRLIQLYSKSLQRRPFTTQIVSSAVLWCVW